MRNALCSARAAFLRMARWLRREKPASVGISLILHLALVTWCVGVGGASASRTSPDVSEVDIVTAMPPALTAGASVAARGMNDALGDKVGEEKSLSGVEKEEALPVFTPAPAPELMRPVCEKAGEPEHPSRERGAAPEPAPPAAPRHRPDGMQGESPCHEALWKSRVRGILDLAWKNPDSAAKIDLSLKTTYLLKVSRDGALLDKRLLISSGNASFDRSVQLALEKARRFPRPPETLLAGRESVEFPMSFAPSG
jgi:TonB family protein